MTKSNPLDVLGDGFRNLRLHDMDGAMLTLSIDYELGDQPLVRTAVGLASLAHRDQTRPGSSGTPEPYINHPLRNTLRLIRLSSRDPEALAATALHDTVEDQPERLVELLQGDRTAAPRDEARRLLSAYFEGTVSDTVWAVTNPPRPSGLTIELKNAAYVEHVTAVIDNPRVYLVKVSDFIDNAGSLSALADPVKRNRLREKYGPLVPIFQDAALRHGDALGLDSEGFTRLTKRLDDLAAALREGTEFDEGAHFG
ncbi:HD domain-containing protein [Rhodococcoides yunnanense]|uniref:HD domain-containing protein n=1 Tax=Rhodococcoides yunnanense TaxID=278209 RepID=UPI00093300F9|nr:HD domain-containing protein [Rhodococcus yunnanensis]